MGWSTPVDRTSGGWKKVVGRTHGDPIVKWAVEESLYSDRGSLAPELLVAHCCCCRWPVAGRRGGFLSLGSLLNLCMFFNPSLRLFPTPATGSLEKGDLPKSTPWTDSTTG
ncbi:hypothetical protein RHGRI_014311 [Rhododendron griersonianum]|uniref:Uncharacterized protein n=1 Tax=Rhododendron griersonianum TaxID=479676 RepID=A0AAV6K8U9_9ERIC|nr:hypothetical protein RHGRI_014311 [Rhododendron griersonianum]